MRVLQTRQMVQPKEGPDGAIAKTNALIRLRVMHGLACIYNSVPLELRQIATSELELSMVRQLEAIWA